MEQLLLPIEVDTPPGYVWIIRPRVTDRRTGRRRYPTRSRFFRFLVTET